jgi:hypothetical protein
MKLPMNKIHSLTAIALLTSLTITPVAFGQSSAAAQAARLQKLKTEQAAVLARVKAAQAAATAAPTVAPTTAPTPVVAPKPPTVVILKPPTTVATVAPTASVAPKPATSASAAPATSGSVAPVASAAPAAAALALNLDELKKTRTDRRHAEVVDLQNRWGTLLSDPRSSAELKLHAQRSAYLQRIRALGEKANDATFVKGVDALITKEDGRDADAMNALRSGALPAGTAAAVAAPAVGASK